MGKKVLLVRVPEYEDNSSISDPRLITSISLEIPIGVTSLAAVLRAEGRHEVVISDLFAQHINLIRKNLAGGRSASLPAIQNSLIAIMNDIRPDVIGFSALFMFQHDLVRTLTDTARAYHPEALICVGGYCTLAPELLLKDLPAVDIAFISEAEITFPLVLEAGRDISYLSKIDGIAFRVGNDIKVMGNLALPNDLNALPLPAFDMLPLHLYKEEAGMQHLSILTSRSCPFTCNYCASHLYGGRQLRKRDTEFLLSDMETMHSQFGVEFLWIRDDLFNGDKKHSKAFLSGLLDRGLDVPWCDSSSFHVNKFLDLCKASGCSEAIFAIESGSPRVLKDVMNKRVDLDHAMRMGAHCRSIGLPFACYYVIGNPGETKDEVLQTIDFAQAIGSDHSVFSIATPFPGTAYYRDAVKKGQLSPDIHTFLRMKYVEATLEGEEFSRQWLKDTQYDANIRINYFGYPKIITAPEEAAKHFERIFIRYPFQAIAAILAGYCYGQTGDFETESRLFAEARRTLTEKSNSDTYGKYLEWKNPITERFHRHAGGNSSEHSL
jgi:radical SAM superfamily enzyme YgiQ (UPF0313 family)